MLYYEFLYHVGFKPMNSVMGKRVKCKIKFELSDNGRYELKYNDSGTCGQKRENWKAWMKGVAWKITNWWILFAGV